MPIAAAIAITATVVVYLALPVIAVIEDRSFGRFRQESAMENFVSAARRAIDQERLDRFRAPTPDELWTALARSPMETTGTLTNPFTSQPIQQRRSPGNYSVQEIGGRKFLCFYDNFAREIRLDLSPPHKPTTAQ